MDDFYEDSSIDMSDDFGTETPELDEIESLDFDDSANNIETLDLDDDFGGSETLDVDNPSDDEIETLDLDDDFGGSETLDVDNLSDDEIETLDLDDLGSSEILDVDNPADDEIETLNLNDDGAGTDMLYSDDDSETIETLDVNDLSDNAEPLDFDSGDETLDILTSDMENIDTNDSLDQLGEIPSEPTEQSYDNSDDVLDEDLYNNEIQNSVGLDSQEQDVLNEQSTELSDSTVESNVNFDNRDDYFINSDSITDDNNYPETAEPIADVQTISDLDNWLGDINPNFDEFDYDSPYSNNCGSCAYAVYQRLEGQDPDACASAENIPYNSEMEALTGMEQVSMNPEDIEQRLLEMGDGAHAIIGIDRAEGAGHWFNAACIDGKVVAIDGQSGEILDWPPDYGDVVNWEMSVKKGE